MQGRHPEQTSNALGRAAVQIGPRALSLAAEAKHLLGVPYGKTAHFFEQAFGLKVNRSTLARADQRVAQAHHASYEQIQQVVQASPATHVDETGWKVAGRLAWLWTAATRQVTVFLIHRRRGHEVVEDLLGLAYPDKLICDSFLAYEALGLSETEVSAASDHHAGLSIGLPLYSPIDIPPRVLRKPKIQVCPRPQTR